MFFFSYLFAEAPPKNEEIVWFVFWILTLSRSSSFNFLFFVGIFTVTSDESVENNFDLPIMAV